MAELNDDAGATRAHFEQIFDTIAVAMKTAANEADYSIASLEAERFGLIKTLPSKPIGTAWQAEQDGLTVWFQWRYYDQSQSFSVQKDMNILSLELREGDKILREAQERFED